MSDRTVMSQPRPFVTTTMSNKWNSGICDCFKDLPHCEYSKLRNQANLRVCFTQGDRCRQFLMTARAWSWKHARSTDKESQQKSDKLLWWCIQATMCDIIDDNAKAARHVSISDCSVWTFAAGKHHRRSPFFVSGCFAFWCFPCFACKTARDAGECLCLPLLDSFGLIPPITTALRVSIRQRYGIEVKISGKAASDSAGVALNYVKLIG